MGFNLLLIILLLKKTSKFKLGVKLYPVENIFRLYVKELW